MPVFNPYIQTHYTNRLESGKLLCNKITVANHNHITLQLVNS